jgi:hypothetical protein
MDCKTARMMLAFCRPQAGDLDGAERAELEQHLAHCPECQDQAGAQRKVDQHLGRAIRAVEVPDRLRAKILKRLADERGNWYRGWVRQAARAGIAATLLVGIGWGVLKWREGPPTALDSSSAFEWINHISEAPPQRDDVQAYFRSQGVDVQLPRELKYELLTSVGMADFKGRQVPLLVFVERDDNGKLQQIAQVYLLTRKHFRFESLDDVPQSRNEDGYTFNVKLRTTNGGRQAYLICHTGKTCDWLFSSVL